MSWPRDPVTYLVSHHIQQHSTKSTDRTYLSPYSNLPTISIHQTPSIYCWESAFLHRIVEKRTSRHPICWDALVLPAVLRLLSIGATMDVRPSSTNELSTPSQGRGGS